MFSSLSITTGYYKLKHCVTFVFLELGDGWSASVLNSKEELDFVSGGASYHIVIQSYWIGGSTDADKGSTLNYSDYITDESGNELHFLLKKQSPRLINNGFYLIFLWTIQQMSWWSTVFVFMGSI